MRAFPIATALAAILALPSAASAAHVAFSLGDGGTSLVFLGPLSNPNVGTSVSITNSTTGAAVALTDIDFEKETGDLYGVSAAQNAVFQIDPLTGAATLRAALPVNSDAANLYNDWNNAIDRMRIVSSEESTGDDFNFVFNQDANTVTQFTTLAYAAGDPNEGVDPLIIGNAYRDSVATGGVGVNPPPQGGVQLAIDAATSSLVGFANNAGTLTTLASLDFSGDGPGGFDIFSVPDGMGGFTDTGYALLTGVGPGDSQSIRLVEFALPDDLSGGVTLDIVETYGVGQFGGLQGLAIIVGDDLPVAPIPVPPAFAMLATGALGLFALGRRKRA
jgi:hypothetical protein